MSVKNQFLLLLSHSCLHCIFCFFYCVLLSDFFEMSTEASPHQTQHLPSSYPHHPACLPSNEPPRMPNPASSIPDAANGSHSFTADLSINSIKTEDSMSDHSAVAGQPSQPSKGKNGATGPAEGKAKPHVCPICQRGFTTGGHLQRHHRIHTGVKAFKCPFPGCETRTSRQDNLQQQYVEIAA